MLKHLLCRVGIHKKGRRAAVVTSGKPGIQFKRKCRRCGITF